MCLVYLAKHKAFEETVAIKVLHEIYSRREEMRNRFLNEARIMYGLSHDNIVKVRDFIEFNGRVAIVMDYIQGKTLDHIIGRERGPIPHDEALPLFGQILDAVGYAHGKGVAHRDLKPSNVIVTENEKAVVTDFGIAKIMGSAGITRTGTKMGTLYYMSPEQVRGLKEVDHRSDIYSLGMTLYEMLAGRLPFRVDGETSEFDITQQIVFDEYRPPSDFYPHIPDHIMKCVQKAISKDPDARYDSCEEFIDSLNLQDTDDIMIEKNTTTTTENDSKSVIIDTEPCMPDNELEEIVLECGDFEACLGPGPIDFLSAYDWVASLGESYRMATKQELAEIGSLLKESDEEINHDDLKYPVWSGEARDYESVWVYDLDLDQGYWLHPDEAHVARAISISDCKRTR